MRKHEAPRTQKKKKKNKKGTRRKALLVILLMVIVFCGYTIWDVLRAPVIKPPDKTDPPDDTTPDPNPIVDDGGDEPAELKRKEGVYTFVLLGTNDDYNTDTIMLGQVDTVADTVNMVSIPRDTMVDVNVNIKKINNAYGRKGFDEVRRCIEDITGIYPDYYCLVNMEDFVKVVDVIGGVMFDVPYNMYHEDADQKYNINLKAGYQELDGKKAIQLVRYRGTSASDYGRMEVQRDFLLAVAKKMVNDFSPTQATGLINVAFESIKTNMPVKDMIWFYINVVRTMDFDTGLTFETMPGTTVGKYNGQDYVYLDEQATLDYINEKINPYTTDIPKSALNIIKLEN